MSYQPHREIERALSPGCVFVAPPLRLRVEHIAARELPWEIYRGHLLDPTHTRERQRFETWDVFVDDAGPAPAALVSVHWQADRGKLFVVRRILMHGFEPYEDPPGVILSRPVEKWVTELVGTIEPSDFVADALAAELATYLNLAVVGTSRLPITSLESPLPAFSLGQFAYFPDLCNADAPETPWTDPVALLRAALTGGWPLVEQAKALEFALRAVDDDRIGAVVELLAGVSEAVPELFRVLFNHVALSPYTKFVDRMTTTLLALAADQRLGRAAVVDIVSYMLRHLCRHLTAYDLTVFHSFGANYPDALALDALLKAYCLLIEDQPELIVADDADAGPQATRKLRRRALRAAYLARKTYEGHAVPDAPTSMGENLRVLPAPFQRVPEEQIAERGKRRRKLFEAEPAESILGDAARRALAQSMSDLDQEPELVELGMATYLDRPLGICKETGEVDRTPLVASEAFSRTIARQRLARLSSLGWFDKERRDALTERLKRIDPAGVPIHEIAPVDRPGVVSLADLGKTAPDFVLLRSTPGSLAALRDAYDWRALAEASPQNYEWLMNSRQALLIHQRQGEAPPLISLLEGHDLRLTLQLADDGGAVYCERDGVEWIERLQLVHSLEMQPDGSLEMTVFTDELWMELRDETPIDRR